MAYVGEPFAYDIFVSYSHGDEDGTDTSRLSQWSKGFARELESELKAFPQLGREFRIFLDQHRRPSQGTDPLAPLSEQLRSDIERSAMLVVLMSPHYLASKWCQDEREWWCQKQRELGLPLDDRIAVVRVWKTNPTPPWPESLVDGRGCPLVGFWFYDREQAELLPQPFEWPEPRPDSKNPFRKELLVLVGRLALKLEEIRRRLDERARAQAVAARLQSKGGQVVYLHGRGEHARSWDRVADALSQGGLVVLPGEPDPVVNDARRIQEIRHRRIETMSGCDALLLVATDDGRAVDADLVVVGRLDRNSARAMSNQPLPCALLDVAGPSIRTPQRQNAARSLNIDWIDATREPWTPAVQGWLLSAARSEAVL